MKPLKQMILEKYPDFFKELDENLKMFAREIKKSLRDEGHEVIAFTGYPGSGKSNDAAIVGMLIDDNYDFESNICYIPSSKEIESKYLGLPMYGYLHIDEASRGLHKHNWYDKIQQKLRELYDVEREGHFLCTALLMPRFQNFTENFRNFMIKYWINIPTKGLAVFYKRDEDKDAKDPWHIDESYKKKQKKFRGKRIFERNLPDIIRAEQYTDCYWFYCKIPPIPRDVWDEYLALKQGSRVRSKEPDTPEDHRDKISRERQERWDKIVALKKRGYSNARIAIEIGRSTSTVSKDLQEIKANDTKKKEGSGVIRECSYININHSNNQKTIEA